MTWRLGPRLGDWYCNLEIGSATGRDCDSKIWTTTCRSGPQLADWDRNLQIGTLTSRSGPQLSEQGRNLLFGTCFLDHAVWNMLPGTCCLEHGNRGHNTEVGAETQKFGLPLGNLKCNGEMGAATRILRMQVGSVSGTVMHLALTLLSCRTDEHSRDTGLTNIPESWD